MRWLFFRRPSLIDRLKEYDPTERTAYRFWKPGLAGRVAKFASLVSPIHWKKNSMDTITYRAGYKYQLVEPYSIQTSIKPEQRVQALFLHLTPQGMLHIERGYAWDGPSGPAIDTPDFMRASLVHDAFYQLLRMGMLDPDTRKAADEELYRICVEDGMSTVRAGAAYHAVRAFGAAYNAAEKGPQTAPRPFEIDQELETVNED